MSQTPSSSQPYEILSCPATTSLRSLSTGRGCLMSHRQPRSHHLKSDHYAVVHALFERQDPLLELGHHIVNWTAPGSTASLYQGVTMSTSTLENFRRFNYFTRVAVMDANTEWLGLARECVVPDYDSIMNILGHGWARGVYHMYMHTMVCAIFASTRDAQPDQITTRVRSVGVSLVKDDGTLAPLEYALHVLRSVVLREWPAHARVEFSMFVSCCWHGIVDDSGNIY